MPATEAELTLRLEGSTGDPLALDETTTLSRVREAFPVPAEFAFGVPTLPFARRVAAKGGVVAKGCVPARGGGSLDYRGFWERARNA